MYFREDGTNVILCLIGVNGDKIKEAVKVIVANVATLLGYNSVDEIYPLEKKTYSTLEAGAAHTAEETTIPGTSAYKGTTKVALPSSEAARSIDAGRHVSNDGTMGGPRDTPATRGTHSVTGDYMIPGEAAQEDGTPATQLEEIPTRNVDNTAATRKGHTVLEAQTRPSEIVQGGSLVE